MALLRATSPDTTAISPERRDSWSLTEAVVRAMAVAKVLRASDTCLAAWARAAAMFFTVFEKRESARAACLAMPSLMLLTEEARAESAEARCLAIWT